MFCNYSENKRFFKSSKKGFLLLLLFFQVIDIIAQNNIFIKKKYSLEFQIFSSIGFNSETSHQLQFEYDFTRTLLIYQQHLTKGFNFCIAADTYVKNNNEPYNRTPYLKRAYLQYHNRGLSVSAGLIVLEQFKFQRKIWQLRYVDKTFQNKFNYGSNRGIGILVKHKLNSCFSYDVAITSGYYTPIDYSSEKYQLMTGQTFNTSFCAFRLFNSISTKPDYEHIISLFITKEITKGNIGIEIAREISNNKQEDDNRYGLSFFGNYTFKNNVMCYARYDMNKESIDMQTENVIWAGMQCLLKKHINASIYYKNEDLENDFYNLAIFIH